MKSENGDNNGSSINNSASDMSDDESSTLAMINSKKLMEMMPQESVKPDQEMMMARMMKIMRQQGSELLGNLLGISDQGMLNKMFTSSADEAAKLLGVEK